ncbi:MAG TPA: hypothetical protein VG942_04870 [Hyphomonadaceae bacterium]|nr:hypothetical protein [Hyphomonadaceae bacterium]
MNMTFSVVELLVFAFTFGVGAGVVGLVVGTRGERQRWIRRAQFLGVAKEDLLEMDKLPAALARDDRSARLEQQIADVSRQVERLSAVIASQPPSRAVAVERRSPIPPA